MEGKDITGPYRPTHVYVSRLVASPETLGDPRFSGGVGLLFVDS
jgi:hypothetical protein